jgi:UDP-arabinose 4-epimerase
MTGQSDAVLVVGGAGYIGAHVCKALAQVGCRPVVLDNLSAGHADFVRWGPLVRAEITETQAVRTSLAQYDIQTVIDLAAFAEVGESVRDPIKYYANNFAAKIAFLAALRDGGVRRIILSSTCAVYGEPEAIPIAETHPMRPVNPYGRSKLAYEQMLADVAAAGGPRFMALRYFNAAGASADGEIGEAHEPETHLIARAALATLGAAPPLEIFGNDWPTPDGTAIRDYIHVTDLAAAHVAAMRVLQSGAPPAACNLGTGHGTSVAEVLAAFAAAGAPVPHRFVARRPGDASRLVADPSLARQVLGWSTTHSGLANIVGSALAWHRRRFAG